VVVAKGREILAGSKHAAQKFDEERFNLRKLNELVVRKQTNRFAALENLSDSEDMNRDWKNFKECSKTSAKYSLGPHELKQYKS
jgi:hypothetical protein